MKHPRIYRVHFWLWVCAFGLAASGVAPLFAAEAEYDLVIRGGRVVDGTGNPWFHADVAIKGDRIALVGAVPAGTGKREVVARGLTVAPGFIDIHSHSDWTLLDDGNAQSKIRQGVTTEILGEGFSAAPWLGKMSPRQAAAGGRTFTIARLRDYFGALEAGGIAVNVASYAGIGNIWQSALGESFDRPSRADLDFMKQVLDEAMQDGAWGLSSQVMMPPGSLATADDLVELCGVVRARGGIYSTHIRSEGLTVFESIEEALQIAERAQVPVDILHLKIAEQKFWGRMKEIVEQIEHARRRGLNVQANVYPYTRGNNDLVSIIPPWAHEGGVERLLERLRDGQARAQIRRDITQGIPGWYNHYTAVGGDWSRMLISEENRWKGMTMDRVIAEKGKGRNPAPDGLEVLFELLLENRGAVSTVYAHHTEEDMNLALAQPWCSVGSDGYAYATEGPLRKGNPHPRSFGTFPRVLGLYVREKGLLRLEDAVRKMTSLNANKIGLRDRGILRAGCFADVTVFDAAKIIDRARYEDPFQYPDGIEYVCVNGEVVVERGRHTGARPGRVLRHR